MKLATFPPEGRECCSPVHNGLCATPGKSTPKMMTTGKTPAQRPGRDVRPIRQQRRSDDDGKNHRYAENHFFR